MRTTVHKVMRVRAELDDRELVILEWGPRTTVVISALSVEYTYDPSNFKTFGQVCRITAHGYRRQDQRRRGRDWEISVMHTPEELHPLIRAMWAEHTRLRSKAPS